MSQNCLWAEQLNHAQLRVFQCVNCTMGSAMLHVVVIDKPSVMNGVIERPRWARVSACIHDRSLPADKGLYEASRAFTAQPWSHGEETQHRCEEAD